MAIIINYNLNPAPIINGIDFVQKDGKFVSAREITADEAELFSAIPGFEVVGPIPVPSAGAAATADFVSIEALREQVRTELTAGLQADLDAALGRAGDAEQRLAAAEQRLADAEQRATEAEQRAEEAENAARAATAAAAAADAAAGAESGTATPAKKAGTK